MSLGFDALSVLIMLLPGFFCARIFQWLCVRPQQTEMDKVVEALLFSFIVYVSFIAIFGQLQASRKHVIALAALSVAVALISSVAWSNDLLGRLLRYARVTQRTSRPYIWNDVFHHYSGYALVELSDGRWVQIAERRTSEKEHHVGRRAPADLPRRGGVSARRLLDGSRFAVHLVAHGAG